MPEEAENEVLDNKGKLLSRKGVTLDFPRWSRP